VELVRNVYLVGDEKVIQCNIRDITERKQAQHDLLKNEVLLRQQPIWDHLTGLFNRSYMEETLERELLRASRKQLSLGIIKLNMDHFKRFNDTHGHAAGDAILCKVGNFLLKHVRREDITCRYGGDEFMIVLPDASRKVTWERAELIREHFKQFHLQFELQFEGQNLEAFTFSMGVAVFPEDGSTSAGVLRSVDNALYCAKREGRSRVAMAK
jgi:diguanylate cyclase (GGDEF)-like protein